MVTRKTWLVAFFVVVAASYAQAAIVAHLTRP